MANENVFPGPQVVRATQTINIADTPLSAANSNSLLSVDPDEKFLSYFFNNEGISQFTQLVEGKGYLYDAKNAQNLREFLSTELFIIDPVFFKNSFTGTAQAYTGQQAEKGTATTSGTLQIDGNGRLVFENGANSSVAINGVPAGNKRVTIVVDSLADGEAFGVTLRYDGTHFCWATLSRVGSNLIHTIETDDPATKQTSTFPYAANTEFVAQIVGNQVTSTAGSDTLQYTTTITGDIAQISSPGGGAVSYIEAKTL